MIAYSIIQKSYKRRDAISGIAVISRDVMFDEDSRSTIHDRNSWDGTFKRNYFSKLFSDKASAFKNNNYDSSLHDYNSVFPFST